MLDKFESGESFEDMFMLLFKIMEIVNENHLHLELDVFEQDISNIKVGQRISYNVPALGNSIYNGKIHVIGKEFNTVNKTVRIHGHLEGKRPKFIKDLFY